MICLESSLEGFSRLKAHHQREMVLVIQVLLRNALEEVADVERDEVGWACGPSLPILLHCVNAPRKRAFESRQTRRERSGSRVERFTFIVLNVVA